MTIQNITELKKLLKLLREQGVETFRLGDMSFKLGDLPVEPGAYQAEESADPYSQFPQGELSGEALMYYASGGVPGEEPEGLLAKK